MDPLSIAAACVSLTASITKTSISVTTFVRAVRAARSDLDAVSRELASLTTLLELLAEDAKDGNFPVTLRKHITGILANCELVLVEVQRVITKYGKPGVVTGSRWVLAGSEDVAKLQLSLEAHKSALEIALEMVTLSMAKEIKQDTTELRHDTAAIKSDTSEILQEIARLRAQLPDDQATLRPTKDSDSTLARYLDDLTSYAETVCWSGEDSDTDVEPDEGKGLLRAKSVKSAKFVPTLPSIPKNSSKMAQQSSSDGTSTAAALVTKESQGDIATNHKILRPVLSSAQSIPLDLAQPRPSAPLSDMNAARTPSRSLTAPPKPTINSVPADALPLEEDIIFKKIAISDDKELRPAERPTKRNIRGRWLKGVDVLAGSPGSVQDSPNRIEIAHTDTLTKPHLDESVLTEHNTLAVSTMPVPFTVKALFSFESSIEGDLNFEKGQIIHVTKWTDSDVDWWTGRRDGEIKLGIFPSNYVQKCERDAVAETEALVSKWSQDISSLAVNHFARFMEDNDMGQYSNRNTLATIPEAWSLYGGPTHTAKVTLQRQRHDRSNEIVVVKLYPRAVTDGDSHNVRIIREAEILGLFNHPHIIHLQYFTQTADSWLLYLEDAGSITLSQYIAQNGRTSASAQIHTTRDATSWDNRVRKLGQQIASALLYCQSNCVYHYSLRSEKIIVGPTGDAKITGFGHLQLVSNFYDQCFDTFCYGTILWHMLCGSEPWPASENWDRHLRNTSTLVTKPKHLTIECFSLLSELLNGNQASGLPRLSLKKAIQHAWFGYTVLGRRDSILAYVPLREPLSVPLDYSIIQKLTLFDFGSPEYLQTEITQMVRSKNYRDSVYVYTHNQVQSGALRGGIRSNLMMGWKHGGAKNRAASAKWQGPPPDFDSLEFWVLLRSRIASPLLAITHLAMEKMAREKAQASKGS